MENQKKNYHKQIRYVFMGLFSLMLLSIVVIDLQKNDNGKISGLTLDYIGQMTMAFSGEGGESGESGPCDTRYDFPDHDLMLKTCILPWQQKLICKPFDGMCCEAKAQQHCNGKTDFPPFLSF